MHGSKPDSPDADGDGLDDAKEISIKTNPSLPDTDEDGLSDFHEVTILNMDPLSRDTDGDNIEDGDEDSDSDGLSNIEEIDTHNTKPMNADSDDDGLIDSHEVNLLGTRVLFSGFSRRRNFRWR